MCIRDRSLDWTREFATCDPSYYKHQQKLFNDFLRAGLAEREHRKINWDPVDMTVLANEQVIDGRGWRSGALVEQREMNQWVFKITRYSQELLDALDTLDLSLIHISEPTRLGMISYAVFC